MKVIYSDPIWIIDSEERGVLHVGPAHVHNFRLSRPVYRIMDDHPRVPRRLIGVVLGGESIDKNPVAFAEAVLKADREWWEFLTKHPELTNRAWVLNRDDPPVQA